MRPSPAVRTPSIGFLIAGLAFMFVGVVGLVASVISIATLAKWGAPVALVALGVAGLARHRPRVRRGELDS